MLDQLDVATRRERPGTTPTWLIVAIACAGQFMVVLDVSVVNVALPAIRADLGFDATGLQWVVNGYALTFAGFLLVGGRAADLFGRRRVFLAGLVLFTAASLVGGLATGPGVLIAARAVQGFGGAVLSPATLTILTTSIAEGPARNRALGAWTGVGAAGGAVGSVLGGLLTDTLSWRWILLINVPVGAVVVLAAVLWLPESLGGTGRRLDLLGATTATLGLAALAYGVIHTRTDGWGSAGALVPIAAGLLLLAGFVLVEGRVAGAPLMPLRLWRSRAVAGANLSILLTGAAGFAMWYFLSLYMQNVLRFSPLRAGLGFVPHTIAIILASRLAPRLVGRVPTRALITVGLLVAAAGFLWQSRITPSSGYVSGVLGPGVVICAGYALSFAPTTIVATSGVAPGEAGLVSGLLGAARQVGGALGLAVLATVAATASVSPAALTAGYARAFLVSAVLMAAAALAVPLMPRPARARG